MAELRRVGRPGWVAAPVVVAVLATIPIAALATSVLRPNREVWRQQWDTRLPDQIVTTITLTVGVVTASVVLGVGLAWLVGAHRFPGRRVLSWALVLPLAMPGYILGFVTTATFGVAGPVQVWWRDQLGRDAWFPEVRSLPGAIVTLTLTLYPYVYLLARAALRDQAATAALVARTLGASRAEAARRVVLPMLRPAVAAGAAIVAMETLTDFATVQYFNQETITVGVFRIWRGSYDRDAASEIATLVLVFALFAIALERILRGRARFGESGGEAAARRAGPPPRLARRRRHRRRDAGRDRRLPRPDAAPRDLGHRRATERPRHADGRALPRLPRQQPHAHRRHDRHLPAGLGPRRQLPPVHLGAGRPVRRPGEHRRLRRAGAGGGDGGGAHPRRRSTTCSARPAAACPGFAATGSFIALAYAYAIRFLAPGLTAVEAGIGQVHVDVTSSAQSLGASPMSVVRRIHLPLARTSVLAAAVLVGVDALKELPIAYLLRPVGFDTLPVWVFDLASESRFEQAALPALSIIAVALVPVALLSRHLDRSISNTRPHP